MPSRSRCKIDSVLDIVSDAWTLAIVHELTVGPRRTVELYEAFEGMSTKTLTARLKKLQRRGLVNRLSYGESPPRVEYSLTEKGERLNLLLSAIAEIAKEWDESIDDSPDRQSCRACEINAEDYEKMNSTAANEIDITKLRQLDPNLDNEPVPPSLNDVTLL